LRISEDFIDHKIPNFKHQITNKSQIPIFNDRNTHHIVSHCIDDTSLPVMTTLDITEDISPVGLHVTI